MELILVKPQELRSHWQTISSALDEVSDATSADWIKEDVYHAIKSGAAVAHLVYHMGRYCSLFILTGETEEFSGKQCVHIWIAHNAGYEGSYEFGLNAIKDIARASGASRLTLESPRIGWAKRFKLVTATYEVPL